MINCFGTRYRLHPLFMIMMALSVWTGYFLELITLFGIVVIHELGHVAAAKRYGWNVVEVQLLPFGGVAEIDEAGAVTWRQELAVMLAGPLQNGMMILIALALNKMGVWEQTWTDYFIRANGWIGLFNLLPILPLDGGRIVQALLSRAVPYYLTLIVSIWLSLAGSILLLVVAAVRMVEGVIDINLLVIAIFLIVSNLYAYMHHFYRFLRFLVRRKHRTERMLRNGQHVQPIAVREAYDPISLVKLLKREQYHVIYVLNKSGTIQKVLPEERLVAELIANDAGVAASSSAYRQFMLK